MNANSIVDVPGDILQENHYYPFGMNMNYGWMNAAALDNKYQYNGKELNDDFGLNWNDYGARWYEASVGRFPNVDPIIDKFPYLTPYNYASNSPVAKINLYGLQGGFFNEVKEAAVSALGSGLGTATAIVEDMTGANLPSPTSDGTFGKAFETGEQIGHQGMIFTGTLEMGIGAGEMAVGAIAAPATAGASLAISAKGAALAAHGSFVVQNAVRNMSKNDKAHQTYTKTNTETGEVYTGKTSGTGTPEENIAKRDQNHHMTEKGFGPAKLDQSSNNSDAIRGREQDLIEKHGGAKSGGGTSGNQNNSISPTSPNRSKYREASKKEFGN